ncbi:MAG: tRNA (N6-threonylcarbamoyladenosine(37)-N6)-methyltransferase TrmO [Proteobacteria bacterium]|nr:tRNA (N6-threonylcarbamoyladenosine(37)-N6)-methyltransferase TrmO [Pseudomonadota bacterium]
MPQQLILDPIGYLRSPLADKFEAARQPSAAAGTAAQIELLPGRHFEFALADLGQWELLWIIFWFHLNEGWRPKVLPPRSTSGRKGVFATRSPHRPNPIGLSVVRLERIDGLTLHIRDSDILDGTPILDIKPYIAYSDAHPEAGSGWLENADPLQAYAVRFEPLADEQASWVETHTGLALRERIQSTLTLGPEPHPYRRIRNLGEWMQLAVKEWRVRFTVAGRDVHVHEIYSGFKAAQLANGDEPRQPHRDFNARWPR